MSTEQPTIDEFGDAQPPAATQRREALSGRGAAYRPSDDERSQTPATAPENCCLNCGSDISSKTARVIGDNDGCVPGCVGCVDLYRTTAQVVAAIRNGRDGAGIDPTAGGRR